MKPIHIIFVLLIAMAGIVGYVWLLEPVPHASGVPHPEVQAMSVGGDGAARMAALGSAPYWFQVCLHLMVPVLLYTGVAKRRRTRGVKVALGVVAATTLFAWHMVYTSYEAFLMTGETGFFLGFPVPTSWFLYGMWITFILYDLLYLIGFRLFILPYDDEDEFHVLVDEIKAQTPQTYGRGDI